MTRVLRIAGYVVAGVTGFVLLGAGGIYAVSEISLRRTYDVPLVELSPRADSAAIAEGERLARIRGCYGGCHGTALEGGMFFDEPGVATIPAPNLTHVVAEYTDAELERVIRRGVRRNGRSVFAMPSSMFAELADDDLENIIAFLRSAPLSGERTAGVRVGPVGRLGLLLGMFEPVAPGIDATPGKSVPTTDTVEWGRYLVRTTCTECHGDDLRGDPSGSPPDLRIAAAFSETDWVRLMRQGRGLGDRELGLMADVALRRFSYMTDEEVLAVRAYLLTMPTAAVPDR